MSRRLRLFIALELSPDVATHARRVVERLQTAQIAAKWIEPRELHLTLHFLGDVDELDLPELCTLLDEAAAESAPFDVEIRGAGAFPSREHPRTLWLGVRRGAEDLIALQQRLDERLRALGYRSEERRYRPHLTLGRLRENEPAVLAELASQLTALDDYHAGVTDVCEIVLFSSTQSREGPAHEALHVAELRGRA